LKFFEKREKNPNSNFFSLPLEKSQRHSPDFLFTKAFSRMTFSAELLLAIKQAAFKNKREEEEARRSSKRV
jgi:hypothetical protein